MAFPSLAIGLRDAARRLRSPCEKSVFACAGATPPGPPLRKGGKENAVLAGERAPRNREERGIAASPTFHRSSLVFPAALRVGAGFTATSFIGHTRRNASTGAATPEIGPGIQTPINSTVAAME